MKKTEELITITAGGEPGTEEIRNAYSVNVDGDVWYVFVVGDDIYTRRKISGTLETTNYRICQGDNPILMYNTPNLYLFFVRDGKVFKKTWDKNVDITTLSESEKQDDYLSSPKQKHDFDASAYSVGERHVDEYSSTYFTNYGFSVSADYIYTRLLHDSVDLIIRINSFNNSPFNGDTIYGMMYVRTGDSWTQLWGEKKQYKIDMYIYKNMKRRIYGIKWFSSIGEETGIITIYVPVSQDLNNVLDYTKYSVGDYNASRNNGYITASYSHIKRDFKDYTINDAKYSVGDYDIGRNNGYITASYSHIKRDFKDYTINDAKYSVGDYDVGRNNCYFV